MNKKIAIMILICFIIFSSVITSIIHKASSNKLKNNEINNQKVENDTTSPNLVLKESKLIIYQNDILNYEAMVVEATDDVDGDLSSKVEHNVIDTSEVGEYELEYKVKDNAGNEAKQKLEIIVKEPLPVAGD